MEMRLVLAKMIWLFDMKAANNMEKWDPTDNFQNMKAFSTWQKPGLNVYLSLVKR